MLSCWVTARGRENLCCRPKRRERQLRQLGCLASCLNAALQHQHLRSSSGSMEYFDTAVGQITLLVVVVVVWGGADGFGRSGTGKKKKERSISMQNALMVNN